MGLFCGIMNKIYRGKSIKSRHLVQAYGESRIEKALPKSWEKNLLKIRLEASGLYAHSEGYQKGEALRFAIKPQLPLAQ
jgi:hypothetical protein